MRMPSPSLSHLTRSLIALLAIALLGGAPLMPPAVQASETETIDLSSSQQAGRMLRLGLQKSAVLKLPAVVKDVIVGNPGMVDVVLKNRNTAYLFARAAEVSLPRSNDGFHRAKLATARFYMQRVLPDSAALHAKILAGAGPVMEMDEAMF